MKRVMWSVVAVVAISLLTAGLSTAAPNPTIKDAKVLVDKAIAYYNANGLDKTIAEVNNPKGQLQKDGLYVVIQDFKGIILANGGNPALVGQNHWDVKDPNGKLFVREHVEIAKTKGSGTVDFVWVNPATKKVQAKTNYLKRTEGKDFYFMAGVFN